MKLKTIKQIKSLKNKRVLLRLSLNVYVSDKSAYDNWRLLKATPTINYLAKRGAKVIIVAHLGRPNGQKIKSLSLKPMANYLSKLTGRHIELWTKHPADCLELSKKLISGQVVMLENIRWYKAEQNNGKLFSQQLARLADIYVNDAFGNIHRESASMVGVTKYLPSYAGFLLNEEIKNLSQVAKVNRGLVVILGGAKISTKIKLIQKYLRQADKVLLGGGLANTLLAARGLNMANSLVDTKSLSLAKKLKSKKLYLPTDVVIAKSLSTRNHRVVEVDKIPAKMRVVDIGPQTVKNYSKLLSGAKMIVWNGPLGYFENKAFQKNSLTLAKKIVNGRTPAVIGGGETVAMITQAGLRNKFHFVSTGGGSMLAWLENNKLPALNQLKVTSKK